MPNWCSNRVTVSGPAETLTAFMLAAWVGDEALSFDNIYPCPAPLRDAPSGSDGIYYDIAYGDLSAIANYGWIPESIKGDRIALMAFVTNHHGCSAKKAQGIADLIKSNLETYGSKNWYDWCCRAWGTKWGTCNSTRSPRTGDVLEYHFDTAWCPATEGFLEVSRLFPELVFQMEYFEGGMCFCGKTVFQGGEIVEDDPREWAGVDSTSALEEISGDDSMPFCAEMASSYLEMMSDESEVA